MAYADLTTGATGDWGTGLILAGRDQYISATAMQLTRLQTGNGQQALTIFAVPKAFHARFKVIQTNAIRSWTLLRPEPEIILLGDDEGTAQIARELGCSHIADVERNRYGTPLVHSIFEKAQELARNDLVCYVNSDIILMSDFIVAVSRAAQVLTGSRFLLVGRKRTCTIDELLDFEKADWEIELKDLVRTHGRYVTYDSDFFVFPRGMYRGIPPFAIGRCFWTQWLMHSARIRGTPVVDTTPVVMSIESAHDYSHVRSTGGARRLSGVEYRLNRRLWKGCNYETTLDATYLLTDRGLEVSPSRRRLVSALVRLEYYVYFLLKSTLYPYSIPLIVLIRWMRAVARAIGGRR